MAGGPRLTLLATMRLSRPSPSGDGRPMSRSELAEAANTYLFDRYGRRAPMLDARRVGDYERGRTTWPTALVRETLRAVLGVATDAELGFYCDRTRRCAADATVRASVGRSALELASGNEVRRRDHHDGVGIGTVEDVNRRSVLTGAGLLAGYALLPASSLAALLGDQPASEQPRGLSRTHAVEVEELADAFDQMDNGLAATAMRGLADERLRMFAGRLDAPTSPAVRQEYFAAVARFASVAAFMHFDALHHDQARTRFRFALACIEQTGDWQQRASLLSRAARQEVWCGNADAGLTLVESALVRADRLTATQVAMLHTVRARALARLPGRATEALKAVGAADDAFARSEPSADPAWMSFYDAAQHHGDTAHALFDLEVQQGLSTTAAARFAYAIDHHGPTYRRSRALSATKLATLAMLQGDAEQAAALGLQALGEGPGASRRALRDLQDLQSATAGSRHPDIAVLRQGIQRLTTAAA